MHVHKKFGKRLIVLASSEVRKKYFLLFEGEKTEMLYFKGINDHRIQLRINPLIEIKPIMRSFDEKGWSNPKKLLDRLVEYIKESHLENFSLNSIITNVIDFLIIDDVIGTKSIYSPDDIKKKILNYFSNDKKIEKIV
ncbi:MAG: RloB domain-containing protein [Bacillota bacterium]|nr:RloB domain-containing protein [Bacillota bacterium]